MEAEVVVGTEVIVLSIRYVFSNVRGSYIFLSYSVIWPGLYIYIYIKPVSGSSRRQNRPKVQENSLSLSDMKYLVSPGPFTCSGHDWLDNDR